MLALALPATAAADPNYDAFDAASFSDGANGLETAYTSAERLQVAAEYNSQNYTVDATELPPTDRTGCGRPGGGFDVGGRSGWVRFLPGVAGTVRYDVGTPAYRSIVQVWTSDTALRGVVRPSNAPPTFVNVDCNSANTQIGGQYLTVRAVPGKPLWVQTLGYCGFGPSADAACPNNRANAVGGPTRVLMTFTPDNDDADPVADTLDACRGVAGGAADGCPDSDADGISDRLDNCDTTPGPAPTGCPVAPVLAVDGDADGVADSADRCPALKGSAERKGCPAGVRAETGVRYSPYAGGVRMLAYYVKAPKGARVVVTCSRGCGKTVTKGRGAKQVRIAGLRNRRLSNGTRITVTITLKGRLTTRFIDQIKGNRRHKGGARCSLPGTTKPRLAC